MRFSFRLLLLLFVTSALIAQDHSTDFVVYGDSPSAITAAIELAESERQVLLVSPRRHLGGIIVNGLGSQDTDHRAGNGEPIGGLTREFFLRIAKAYDPVANAPKYKFHSSRAQEVIEAWLAEKEVPILREVRLSEAPDAVKKDGNRIVEITCEDGTRISGQFFIDGTVEGDLMAAAGVSYAVGREGNTAYDETVGGIIFPTKKQQFQVDVDPWKVPGDESSGTIFGVQNEPVGSHGEPDSRVMGFCLRLPLTKDRDNQIPITAPEGYDPEDYELYRRFLAAGGTNDWLDGPGNGRGGPNAKLHDLGSWHELSGNFYGRNADYPDGTYGERDAIYRQHRDYTQGLIYFLSTDPSVPESIRRE